MENTNARPIYYFAVERTALALLSWAPCTDPETCPSIDPRSAVNIPFDEIGFWEPSSEEAVVFWWLLEPDQAGGFRPDSVRSMVVRR